MNLNAQVSGDRLSFYKILLTASLLVLVAGILLHLGGSARISQTLSASKSPTPWLTPVPGPAGSSVRARSRVALAHVPLSFEANQGQTDPQVKFLARGGGYTLFLTQDEAVLRLSSKRQQSVVSRHSSAQQNEHSAASIQHTVSTESVVRMSLVGADSHATVSGSEELPSRSNYFIGNDPRKWQRDVPQYARVRYRQVYPGVDLVYYGNQGRLEYDFEVAPGADPQQIGLRIDGAKKLRIDSKGNLLVETDAGDLQLHVPEVYQHFGNQKRAVTGKFVLSGDKQVHFAVGGYDRSRALVIDPVLNFSTYFGGNLDEGCAFLTGTYATVVAGCPAIAVDGSLNRYIAGTTNSTVFPTSLGAFQTSLPGTASVFVAKFNSAGAIMFSTYLGGNAIDTPVGIAVDSITRNVYVAGNTTSITFPVLNGFQTVPPSDGKNHVFASVLKPDGSGLVYSTYLYGNGIDTATGLAADNAAGEYVTGFTTSNDAGTGFPSTSTAFQVSSLAANQFFFTKINTADSGASSLVYSSYLGGSIGGSGRTVGGGIAVDGSQNVYLTGSTDFTNMPVLNAYQGSSAGGLDVFIAKFNVNQPGAAGHLYLTYLGGSGDDIGYGIAVDSSGNAYVAGSTTSTNFPISSPSTAFQAANAGGIDAFVAKIGSEGNTLSYSSFLGGTGTDVALAIAVDSNQGAHITGLTTSSTDFNQVPLNAVAYGGGPDDAFVALMQTTTSTGTTGGYSRYLGGNAADDGTGIAVDTNTTTYVAGETNSTSFPVTNGSSLNGGANTTAGDAFISTFSVPITLTMPSPAVSPNPAGIGNQVTFTYTITNNTADVATNIILSDALPASGATFASASSTPGSCTAVVNGTITCSVGALAPGKNATVKINLTPTVAGTLSNGANLIANGVAAGSASNSVTVTDFTVGVSPSTATVVAGNSATYQVQIGIPSGQTHAFPNQASLSCSAGVPSGAACTFSTNPLSMTNTSPVSSTLTITTTARPVTSAQARNFRFFYGAFLPLGGLTFLGVNMGPSRRRRWRIAILAALAFGLVGLQLACGSGSGTTTPPVGTPAGTYAITVTATSGSASHAARMTLVVQ